MASAAIRETRRRPVTLLRMPQVAHMKEIHNANTHGQYRIKRK